jgi:large subunit ribosomal protein L25
MAKQIALAAERRTSGGKGEARRLRRAGKVPAIAYGAGLEPTAVSVDALELYHVLHTGAGANAVISLGIDGGSQLVLAREIQRHPVRRDILHVDFVAVQRDVKVEVDVPITLTGEAPGSEDGGVVSQELYQARVSVLPLEVPEQFELDISQMQVGDVLRLEDMPVPSGVELIDDPDRSVVSVVVPTVEPTEGVEEALEPEEGEAAAEDRAEGATADESENAEG